MRTSLLAASASLLLALLFVSSAQAQDLNQVSRQIGKQPDYQTETPKYCLAVFGPEVETRVWLVQDGDALYVDLNHNGDLTDDGEKITAESVTGQQEGERSFKIGDFSERGLTHKRFHVLVEDIERLAENFDAVAELLAEKPDAMGYRVGIDYQLAGALGTGLGGRTLQWANYQDANGVLQFADSPEEAPILHFGGPWTIGITNPQELIPGREVEVYVEMGTPGIGPGTKVQVGYELLVPETLRPTLEFSFPSAEPGGAPVVARHELKNRCCTFSFHGPIKAPENAGAGTASVNVSMPGWSRHDVTASTGNVTIAPTPAEVALLPVSPGIKRELIHPNRDANMGAMQFSPDGTKLLAGDYPGGVIMLWDVETGEQLTEIHALSGLRGTTEYFHVTPDWRHIYVAEENNKEWKIEYVERDGERLLNDSYGSYIRCWDLETGDVVRDYQHSPPRKIRGMMLLNDQQIISQFELLPGIRGEGPTSGTIWDIATGKPEPLPGGAESRPQYGPLSPNGMLLGSKKNDELGYTKEVHVLDAATFETRATIPVTEEYANYSMTSIEDSGRIMAVCRVYDEPSDWAHWRSSIRWWDGTTGEEIARFDYSQENDDLFAYYGGMSPDGKRLAAANFFAPNKQLYIFNMDGYCPERTVDIAESEPNGRIVGNDALFTPDGKWIVYATQQIPERKPAAASPTAYDLQQPRIHIIEAATGEIRKTLIAPQAIGFKLTLSPDGKTLATSGLGKVLLWDMDEILSDIEAEPPAEAR